MSTFTQETNELVATAIACAKGQAQGADLVDKNIALAKRYQRERRRVYELRKQVRRLQTVLVRERGWMHVHRDEARKWRTKYAEESLQRARERSKELFGPGPTPEGRWLGYTMAFFAGAVLATVAQLLR